MDAQLYKAAASGNVEFIANDDPNVLLQQTTPQRNSLLHVALLYKQKDFAEKILQRCPSLLYHNNSEGDTPLHIAARVGSTEIVQHILERFVDDASRHQVEAEQISPTRLVNVAMDTVLHDAVRNGHLGVVEFLLARDPELALLLNAAGESPLFLAMERKLFDIAKHLLHNAQVCSYEGRDGMNALHAATLRVCEFGLLKEMVSKCPTTVVQADNLECTPLHYAALLGYKEAIELFLTDGSVLAHKNTLAYKKDKQGMSAFHLAAKNGHVEVMEKLMKICPDISEQLNCINRQTALHVAVQGGRDKAVQYLLTSFGSEGLLNKQDKDGNTPLHLAAIVEDSPILEILIKVESFDANLINMDGLTALDILQSSTQLGFIQKEYLVSRLESAGGLPNLKEETVGTHIRMEQLMQTKRRVKPQEDIGDGSRNPEDQWHKPVSWREFMDITKFLSPSVVKNASNDDMLIITLIATVTFAAAFQVPGGYVSDGPHQGYPILRNKLGFNLFIIFDCLAFGLSSGSILFRFLASSFGGNFSSRGNHMRGWVVYSTFSSILAMVGAFGSALYLVSDYSWALKIAAYVFSCGGVLSVYFSFLIRRLVERIIQKVILSLLL